MPKFKEGDRVQVKARPVQGKEAIEGLYAPHLGGTHGTILKVYSPQEIAVDLDIDSLPEGVRDRHAEQQSAMHEKWLNSLSDEARNRLTDEEKQFQLRYVVLLSEADLEPPKQSFDKTTKTPPPARKPADFSKIEPAKVASKSRGASQTQAVPTPSRPTPEQLDKLEEQYLKARKGRRR